MIKLGRKTFVRCFSALLVVIAMLTANVSCNMINSLSDPERKVYDLETDMLYINGEILKISEARVVADVLWDSLNGQYSDIFSNPATLSEPIFQDDTMSLETYEKEYSLYREMMFLMCFAQSYDALEITPTWEISQRLNVSEVSKAFFEKHYEKASNAGVTREDCDRVFGMYAKAREYQEYLKKKIDLIISDEDVRVVACNIVRCKDRSLAEEFLKNVKNGGDFTVLSAGVNELDHISYYVTRDSEEFPKDVIDQLFLLETGQYCEKIEAASDHRYYVYYIVDMFHEKLSKQNRERKLAEKIYDYYDQVSTEYIKNAEVYFNRDAWEAFGLRAE